MYESGVPGHDDSSMSTNPLMLGTICGLLHAVGPDHLATLITFSALMNPWAAAKVGVAVGAGHCAGIIAVGILVVCFSKVLPGIHVHIEHWEYYGDYLIGLSMVVVSSYFMCRENEYVETMSDGSLVVKGCACHGDLEQNSEQVQHHTPKSPKKKELFCQDFRSEGASSESSPLLARDQQFSTNGKGLQGALVGLVQGMCCPMGLVSMGASAGKTTAEIAILSLTTIAVSILGTGAVAAGWAYLSSSSWMSGVNPKFVYRISCLVGLVLGVLWMFANYCGVLHKLNFAEGHHAMM